MSFDGEDGGNYDDDDGHDDENLREHRRLDAGETAAKTAATEVQMTKTIANMTLMRMCASVEP